MKDIMEGFEKIGELIFCPFVHYAILLMSISELDLTTLDSNGPSAIDTFVAVRQGENAELISVKVFFLKSSKDRLRQPVTRPQ